MILSRQKLVLFTNFIYHKLSMKTAILTVFLALAVIACTIKEVDGKPGIMPTTTGGWLMTYSDPDYYE